MKKRYLIIAMVATATLGVACGNSEEATGETADTQEESTTVETVEEEEQEEAVQTGIAKDLTAEEFKVKIDAGDIQLIDVRTPGEVADGAIEGSVNIDWREGDFEARVDAELDPSKPVAVYCKSGGRSGQAMELLTERGFVEVYNLVGGYSAWPYK